MPIAVVYSTFSILLGMPITMNIIQTPVRIALNWGTLVLGAGLLTSMLFAGFRGSRKKNPLAVLYYVAGFWGLRWCFQLYSASLDYQIGVWPIKTLTVS